MWRRLGSRVGVLSATLPTPLVDLVRTSLHSSDSAAPSVTVVEAAHTDAPVRHRLRTVDSHLTDPAVQEAMVSRLAAGESVLVVANNVADAQTLYEALSPHAPRLSDGQPAACLLHSRFKRCDRAAIEEVVNSRYRSGLPAQDRQPGLVVATQVVEVSLDVDFDVIFTSCAPLDALAQRFGRVNRTGARPPADVIVCQAEMRPRRNKRRNSPTELFADGVYEQAPTEAAWRVLTGHDGEVVSEASLVGWLDDVYDSDWGRRWVQDVTYYRDAFTGSFLTFSDPFDDRSALADSFDEMFEGTEGILATDMDEYAGLLNTATTAQGRLLAADLLIPLPYFGSKLARWDRRLGVAVVDGDYDPERGLTAIRGQVANRYQPGELI